MVFYAAFNSISVISLRQLTLFMPSWVSPVRGWALKCLAQGHSHEKTQEDPVRLESRTPELRVKHSTTEPRGTRGCLKKVFDLFGGFYAESTVFTATVHKSMFPGLFFDQYLTSP